MEPIAVKSTTLATIAYDDSAKLLQLEFRTGPVYHYFDVPPQIFAGLMQALSKGQYFNHDIRGRFPYTLIPNLFQVERT